MNEPSTRTHEGAGPPRGVPRASVAGAVGLLLLVAFLLRLFPWQWYSPPQVPIPCLANVKNIALALQMYLADNDDRFPAASSWCDTLQSYVKNVEVYRCPSSAAAQPRCHYAYNASLDEMSLLAVGDLRATVAIFESDLGWNAAGGPELLPERPRHLRRSKDILGRLHEDRGDHYGFADGSARWLAREKKGRNEVGEVIWGSRPADDRWRWEPSPQREEDG